MKSLEELQQIKERALQRRKLSGEGSRAHMVVAMGTCGIAAGARDTMSAILKELEQRDKEIERQRQLHNKQIKEQKELLEKCLQEKKSWQEKAQKNIREQLDSVLGTVIEEGAKLRKENKKLKAQVQELEKELQELKKPSVPQPL